MKLKATVSALALVVGTSVSYAADATTAPATTPVTTAPTTQGATATPQADETATKNLAHPKINWLDPNSDATYRNLELTLEAFGFGSVSEHTIANASAHSFHHQSHLGAGAGIEFFFNKYVGIEAEGFTGSTSHNFVDAAGGHLVLRYPIGESGFAPYIFGGAGHQFDPVDGLYFDGGIGAEYRFLKWFGVFVDARYVAIDRSPNYGLGRAGVRFTF